MPPPRRHTSLAPAADTLGRVAPLVSRWVERLLAGHEPPLTLAQFLALQAVDEGELVGSELARRTAVSPAAISQLLGSLEDAGLLERVRAPGDRRRLAVTLTAAGTRTMESARSLLRERLGIVLADLPRPELDALARVLFTLDALLAGRPPPPRPGRRPPPPPAPPR